MEKQGAYLITKRLRPQRPQPLGLGGMPWTRAWPSPLGMNFFVKGILSVPTVRFPYTRWFRGGLLQTWGFLFRKED